MLMKNNFLSKVTKMPQNTGGGNLQTKRATFALPLRYLCAMLLALFMGVGQMWGTCPTAGTIYKFVVKTGLTNNSNITDQDISITTSNYLSDFSGSTGATLSAYNKDKKFQIADNSCFKLTDGSKSYLILNLGECTIQAGDIVKTIITSQNAYLYTSTGKDDTNKALITKSSSKTVYNTLVVTSDMDIVGSSTLYLYNASNSSQVYSLEIIRPYTITLDATTNGGTISTTSVKGASGDKVVLPHAFKTGYKFKGWYTDASGGTKQANLYTVSGNATFFAQFEDLSASGEMFSLSMKSELKPAANCTIKNAAGFATQVDMLTYATVDGGAAFFKNASSNNHAIITSAGAFNFNGSNAVMEIPLDFALKNGDAIQTDFTNKIWLSAATTKPSSGPFVDGSNKTYTIEEGDGLKDATTLYLYTGSSGATATSIVITRPAPAATYDVTLNPAGGTISPVPTGWTYDNVNDKYIKADVEDGSSVALLALTKSGYLLDGWKDGESTDYTSPVTIDGADLTLTAQWASAHTVSFEANGGGSSMSPVVVKDGTTYTIPACDFTPADANHAFSNWTITGVAGKTTGMPDETFTMPAGDVTLTAQWSASYTVAEGTHTNGSITFDPTSAAAGTQITLTATPDEDYLFSAWDVCKTGETSTKVTVTNNKFTMPEYNVTVNAIFVTDPRSKVLYLTTNSADATKTSDKLYAALKDAYNVKIQAPASQTLTDYALVVLHESINGKAAAPDDATNRKQAVLDAKTTSVPVLNAKTYFYNSGRWDWGTPNNGQADQRTATLNSGYCNVADHPIFAGVTITAGAVTVLTDGATGNTMQPVEPSSGKEGYLLATTPNKEGGESSYAIQEIPAGGFRGASSGKYILISVSNAGLNNLTTDGQKLFKNAADYLTSATTWDPISVPTSPEVTATPSENYTEGNTITLTASATGTSASTTYTWYKGDNWAAASATTPVQAAATAASDGNVFTKTAALVDAGTYWCNISNGTSCDAQASVTITVSSASTPTHTISYDNVKGADMTAYPTEYTEGIGVASFDPLADITGWHFVEWSPASIATTAITDQTITAVWAQVFEVTFDLRGHGASIDAQNIVDGGKVTKPDDPVAIGYDFGGWFTDEECTAGNEFDFNTSITAATPLYAKWTEFEGCALLVPATSGDAPAVGDPISMQTGSKGGSMSVVGTPLSYNAYGLSFESSSSAKAKVTINNEIQEGTVISLTLVANGTSSPRGLHLYTGDGATKITSLGWTSDMVKYTEETYTYTVQSTDVALIGTNEFQLWRNSSVFLKQLTVTNCGDPVIFHNLTSEIAPDHDPAYATVTLGASSVREGYTTTATYSDIDAAYEFDEWQISGTGASIADASANPAVITMGTADAVVTLKLKTATPKHTVTFNKMGKGDDIAPALVAEGAKVTEPTVTEPEGWMLEGWYKESTLENKWDFATDVMGNTDIELFANWVADTSIKLINKSTGAINTTNFTTAVAAEADVDGEKGAVFNANRDAISSVSALNEMVQYNATTTQTKIQLVMYNTSSAEKTIHLFKVAEGDDAATLTDITIDGNSRKTTEYYTFNSDKNRSFYITVSDKKVQILQMRVVESGTALKQFGQAGYSLNLNKGRIFAKNDGSAYPFEGGSIKVSSDYKVLNNSNLATKSYIQFNNAVAGTILKVTRSGGNYYVSQDPEEKGTIYNANAEVELTATGTWYLGSQTSGSAASFTKIEFIAPKCAEPQFNALANSDICSGDPYVALDGTATVADAGVPTYKWYAEGADESDPAAVLATTATYTPSADGNYYVIATNHLGGYTDNTKKSDLVSVTTHSGTAITEGLAHVRKTAGVAATLTVEATGKNLHYAWKESETIDGTYTDVAGATDSKSLEVVVPDGAKYYKVIVSSDCGANQESIAKVEKFVPVAQVVVDNSVVWDLTTCADAQIQLKSTTSPKKGEECLMANIEGVHMDDNFHSESLVMSGEYIYRNVTGKPTCAEYMKFETSVAGLVRVHFAGNGENRCLRITSSDNVQYSSVSTGTGNDLTEEFEVAAGVIELMGMDSEHTSDKRYMRFYQIEFYTIQSVTIVGLLRVS